MNKQHNDGAEQYHSAWHYNNNKHTSDPIYIYTFQTVSLCERLDKLRHGTNMRKQLTKSKP